MLKLMPLLGIALGMPVVTDHKVLTRKLTNSMEPGGPMPHSQGLSNNPYPELNQPNYPH